MGVKMEGGGRREEEGRGCEDGRREGEKRLQSPY